MSVEIVSLTGGAKFAQLALCADEGANHYQTNQPPYMDRLYWSAIPLYVPIMGMLQELRSMTLANRRGMLRLHQKNHMDEIWCEILYTIIDQSGIPYNLTHSGRRPNNIMSGKRFLDLVSAAHAARVRWIESNRSRFKIDEVDYSNVPTKVIVLAVLKELINLPKEDAYILEDLCTWEKPDKAWDEYLSWLINDGKKHAM